MRLFLVRISKRNVFLDFDDDTGWAETAFGVGYDSNDSLGVDSLETGSYTDNSQVKLHMFYR